MHFKKGEGPGMCSTEHTNSASFFISQTERYVEGPLSSKS